MTILTLIRDGCSKYYDAALNVDIQIKELICFGSRYLSNVTKTLHLYNKLGKITFCNLFLCLQNVSVHGHLQ